MYLKNIRCLRYELHTELPYNHISSHIRSDNHSRHSVLQYNDIPNIEDMQDLTQFCQNHSSSHRQVGHLYYTAGSIPHVVFPLNPDYFYP